MRMVLDSSNWSKFKSSLHSPMCRYDCMSSTCLSPHRLGPPTHATDHASSHDLRYIYILQYSLKRGTCEYRSVMCQCQRCLDYHRALSTGPPSGPEHLARETSSPISTNTRCSDSLQATDLHRRQSLLQSSHQASRTGSRNPPFQPTGPVWSWSTF